MINKDLIIEVIDWHKKAFPLSTLENQFLKLEEELKEVEEADNMKHFCEELVDCYIVAFGIKRWSELAYNMVMKNIKEIENNADWHIEEEYLENLINWKLEINKARKWEFIDGIYKHIGE